MNKKISVLMSVYNSENTLEDSIKSILNQTFTDFEFLISDDGSTDGSVEILKSYEKIDSRINIYFNKENIGLTKSLNKLLKHSSSEYIARQDSDDKRSYHINSSKIQRLLQFSFINTVEDAVNDLILNFENGNLINTFSEEWSNIATLKKNKQFLSTFKN